MATLDTDVSKEFRYMLLHIAEWLKPEECKGIVYVENLPLSYNAKTALEVLARLEANGEYSPLNPDGLLKLLTRLNRSDLARKVKEYKASSLFKKTQKEEKRKKDHKTHDHEAKVTPFVKKLDVKISSPSSNPHSMLREAYAITLTHTALLLQQVELLRKAIDADTVEAVPKKLQLDPTYQSNKTAAAFQAIAEAEDNVEKLRKNLRKTLLAVGIGSSSSSDERTSCTSGSIVMY